MDGWGSGGSCGGGSGSGSWGCLYNSRPVDAHGIPVEGGPVLVVDTVRDVS